MGTTFSSGRCCGLDLEWGDLCCDPVREPSDVKKLKSMIYAIWQDYAVSDRLMLNPSQKVSVEDDKQVNSFRQMLLDIASLQPPVFKSLGKFVSDDRPEAIHHIAHCFDTNHDGSITFAEFYRTLCLFADDVDADQDKARHQRMRLLFSAIDMDNSGTITQEELARFLALVRDQHRRVQSSSGGGAGAGSSAASDVETKADEGDGGFMSWAALLTPNVKEIGLREFKDALDSAHQERQEANVELISFLRRDKLFRLAPPAET